MQYFIMCEYNGLAIRLRGGAVIFPYIHHYVYVVCISMIYLLCIYVHSVQTKIGNVRLSPSKGLVQAKLQQDVLQIFIKNLLGTVNIDVEQVSFTTLVCISQHRYARDLCIYSN